MVVRQNLVFPWLVVSATSVPPQMPLRWPTCSRHCREPRTGACLARPSCASGRRRCRNSVRHPGSGTAWRPVHTRSRCVTSVFFLRFLGFSSFASTSPDGPAPCVSTPPAGPVTTDRRRCGVSSISLLRASSQCVFMDSPLSPCATVLKPGSSRQCGRRNIHGSTGAEAVAVSFQAMVVLERSLSHVRT